MSLTNIKELKQAEPCPFCGNMTSFKIDGKTQNKYRFNNGEHKNYRVINFTVRCNKCHARGPTASTWLPYRYTQEEYEEAQNQAIEKWNQRIINYQ